MALKLELYKQCAQADAGKPGHIVLKGSSKTNAMPDEMNLGQIGLAKDAGCLAGSQGFCEPKMAEIQPSGSDESF